jgi:hypothetical protein
VAHPSPFYTVRNVSWGNALCRPGRRDEHGGGTDPAGKRHLLLVPTAPARGQPAELT